MTTITNFVPNNVAPFTWQPTLDGAVYTATVTWNLFGQRWYLNVFDLTGNPILTIALAGSPIGQSIASLTWDDLELVVDVVTETPHGYQIGQTVELTLSGNVPDTYNGVFECLITGDSEFTFPQASDPGVNTALGAVAYNINLVAGYFESTLVYREANQTFEVSP
jgi:hypothetical protein